MALIATLLPNPVALTRLRAALRDRYELVPCTTWDDLVAACGTRPVAAAVIDPHRSESPDAVFDGLRILRRRYPSVTVVVYAAVPPTTPRDLFELGRFGLDSLAIFDADDHPRRFLWLVEQAAGRGVAEVLRRALGDADPTARDATLAAVSRAHERLSPASLARVLGIRRKLLTERLLRSGFPSPQPLIAWGRLIVAARMLEDEERSADAVAMALEFPSGSAFRNTCQRYLGLPPHRIRALGGARYVMDAFLRGVAEGGVEDEGDADDLGLAAEAQSAA